MIIVKVKVQYVNQNFNFATFYKPASCVRDLLGTCFQHSPCMCSVVIPTLHIKLPSSDIAHTKSSLTHNCLTFKPEMICKHELYAIFLKNTMTNSDDITGHVTGRGSHKQANWPHYIWREVFNPPTSQKFLCIYF